jgi:hypothetical protein
MVRHKRIAWLMLIVIAAASVSLFIATRLGRGAARVQPPQRITMKVLRRHDQLHLKPTAREIQDNQPAPEERLFENLIPSHLPVKVKIRTEKEKAFKDLKNDKWAQDLELEVTNSGDKPIYSLSLLLVTDVRAAGGYRIVFPLSYGRVELGDIRNRADTNDVPIKPGEKYVFRIHPGQIQAWEIRNRQENRPHPKKIQVKFEALSFGDGTGYVGNEGEAIPHARHEQSGRKCINNAGDAYIISAALDSAPPGYQLKFTTQQLPANFLPVKFFSPKLLKSPTVHNEPNQPQCCPGFDCTSLIFGKEHVCLNCPDQNRVTATDCSDPNGSCRQAVYDSIECPLRNGETFTCQTIDLLPCGGGPTPTPSPSPSPTPTPSPTPVPCPMTAPGNCASGIGRDYCTNPTEDDPLGVQQGCPIFFHAEGLCCVRDTCPAPTPTPPPCSGALFWQGHPLCSWSCSAGAGDEIGGGGSACTPYYWVWFYSDDGGAHWYEGSATYCCCL